MNNDSEHDEPVEKPVEGGGHAGHAMWMMVACCLPMIVIFALIALKVI